MISASKTIFCYILKTLGPKILRFFVRSFVNSHPLLLFNIRGIICTQLNELDSLRFRFPRHFQWLSLRLKSLVDTRWMMKISIYEILRWWWLNKSWSPLIIPLVFSIDFKVHFVKLITNCRTYKTKLIFLCFTFQFWILQV